MRKAVKATFHQLNDGWNADPNVPDPEIKVVGKDNEGDLQTPEAFAR
jgi:hypothetical protein